MDFDQRRAGGAAFCRRRLLQLGLGASAAVMLGGGHAQAARIGGRTLRLEHLHTGERLNATYWENGRYLPDALGEINHLLRDFRTGTVAQIDPRLLDILYGLGRRIGCSPDFAIIGGYRSPHTNEMLRSRSRAVAKNSYHMRGQAIDMRLNGCRLADLRRAALALRAGGVGYYPGSNFVHVDTGPVRSWG